MINLSIHSFFLFFHSESLFNSHFCNVNGSLLRKFLETLLHAFNLLFFYFNMSIVLLLLSVQVQRCLGILRDVVKINIEFFCEFQLSVVLDVISINPEPYSIRDAKEYHNSKDHKGIRKLVFEFAFGVLSRPKITIVEHYQFFLRVCVYFVTDRFVDWVDL
jgi:hypothetical protein